ncbi:BTB/POZ domain-containing protein KCTD12 isoform X2 [Eurytemora carolleeae]|uniref:BTB/POZ domain-containing protein KCTD12 isoform X2 n=1 Tax=Eurytemora carolleeae TaxID=1294199 RepID=UPI000C76BE46|nr:BTB/POZ domain-containing protein KCTD12 isoform X2 [Eurytemora carolleeae]|eukprot:XP_023323440.1 BTB/POZ domain-containing protein KCTD12-like isoform X2 [Eurytemora affinis]
MDALKILDLNVGGVLYTTSVETLLKDPDSMLYKMFSKDVKTLTRDSKGRIFLDRDGQLFRYILDYLRNGRLSLPANFQECGSLRTEAEYFSIQGLVYHLSDLALGLGSGLLTPRKKRPSATDMSGTSGGQGYIVVGYRGTFAFGRDMSDIKFRFRKLTRILVHGKVTLCREVFKDTLNDSRDPDRGMNNDRYTSRYYLKHTVLEHAFDQLCEAGFRMVGSCGTGTSAPTAIQDLKPGQVSIEDQWNHYNEFVFVRDDPNSCTCNSTLLFTSNGHSPVSERRGSYF